MSEETTKPSGSREMNVEETEETEDVKKRIEKAEYEIEMNAFEARFSEEKVQEDGTTGGSDSAKPTKAGDHTIVPNKITIAFRPLIPYIVKGPNSKLKQRKQIKQVKQNENREQDRLD